MALSWVSPYPTMELCDVGGSCIRIVRDFANGRFILSIERENEGIKTRGTFASLSEAKAAAEKL